MLVAHVLGEAPLNIQFRRSLVADKWISWVHLIERLMVVTLSNEPDTYTWKLRPSGVFSVGRCADYSSGSVIATTTCYTADAPS